MTLSSYYVFFPAQAGAAVIIRLYGGQIICFGVCFPSDECAHADNKHADFSEAGVTQVSTVLYTRVAILDLQSHSTALSTVQLKLFMTHFYDTSLLVYPPN